MAKMTDSELLALVDTEFESAMGAPGGEISQERAQAWRYYLSKPLGNEVEGQSEIVTSDVADAVDGIMPSLLRIFTISDNLIDFEPVGAEDIEQAQQESDYVNHVFFKKNPAFMILYNWFFDALVQKNGIVKAWWDESERATTETYKDLTDDELAELMDDEELEAVERDERTETVVETLPTPIGPVEQQIEVTFHDVTFKRTTKDGRLRVANVPPEEYRISADTNQLDPNEARMVGHERDITRSDLIEMGIDKDLVDSLPATNEVDNSEEEIARHDKTDEDRDTPVDRSQEKIAVREAYIKVDYDGDGRSELRQIISAGKILSNEEVDRQPFHVICPQPLPHKHFGRAYAEKVMDVQQISTTLVRQIMENLYLTNNPEQNVWEAALTENTLDDLLTRRAGKVNRFGRPVKEAYSTNAVPFTAAESFPMLEYWEKVKRDRTGINSDSEGLTPEQLKHIQSSVMAQANDLSRMKIEAVVRIFAETGVKSLFRHIHELLLKHQDKEEIIELRGQWVPVKPSEWRSRQNMTVRIGLGVGTKEQNLIHLESIWEKQRSVVESGGMDVLVTGKNLYNTFSEFVKNANLKSPQMFFRDPGDAPLQQNQEGPSQVDLAMQQLRNDAQENEIDRERNLLAHEREVQKLAQNQEKMSNDLMVELEKIANKLTELDLEHTGTDVPGSRTQGDGQ